MSTEHDEFAELFGANQQRLFGYILALVRNSADAHDILQQTAVALWKKFPEFEPGTAFDRWAITVARYETLNFLKYRRRNRVYFDHDLMEQLGEDFSEMNDLQLEARRDALGQCLSKLANGDRRLIDSRYAMGLGSRQIAQLLDRSQASICNSLRRIRESLLECIERTTARGDR